ncbi:MAG: YDG domain-containing protein, partial [Terrimicrobiaceae bacterium]
MRDSVEHFDGTAKGAGDVGQSVTPGHSVFTKEQSLAELTADDKSIIRLGANSVFSYSSAERIVKLDKGTMLMHTPPGNGGATIDSGGVVGAISGTTFMLTASPAKCQNCGQELEIKPNGKIVCRDHPDLKPANSGFALIVLEGSSVTKVTGADGQTVEIMPGQMAVVGGKGSGAPKVFAVNLAQVVRTSPLINAFPTPLPSMPQIMMAAINSQSTGATSTGTSAVAIGSGGQLLTAASPPPNPTPTQFLMASTTPGQNANANNSSANLGNIQTAAGPGSGGPAAPTGVAGGGGGGFAGPTLPSIPAPPSTAAQQGISANPNNVAVILPATVVNASVPSKTYDGLVAASIRNALLSGIQAGDSVSLQNDTTGAFASKNVGSWSVSTTMGLIGADAASYSLTQPSLSGTITAKDLRVVNAVVTVKVYDGTTDAGVTGAGLGLSAPGQGTSTDGRAYTGDAVNLANASTGQFADKNVGSGKSVTTAITLSGADMGNYTLLNQPTLTGTITAKDLSVFSAAVTTKVYDGSDAALVTGAVLVGSSTANNDGKYIGSEVVTLAGATSGTFASKNVGVGQAVTTAMTLAGADAGNYTLLNQPAVTGTITAKALTISATTPSTVPSKVYNGNTVASVTVGTLDGLVGTEVLGSTTVVGTFADKNIGTKSVTAVYTLVDGANPLDLASNYSLASETLTGTITAKDLSVFSAAVTTKVYDGSDAAVVTGAVLVGSSAADNDGKYIGSEVVTLAGATSGTFASKNVGVGQTVTTTMTLGGADAGNYTLLNQPATTGTITSKALTIAAATPSTVGSKVYNGSRDAAVTVGTLDGLISGEVLGATTAVGTFADKNIGTKSVTAVYTLTDGANPLDLASNYSLATETLSGTITAKDLSVFSAAVTTKVYNGSDAAVVTGAV